MSSYSGLCQQCERGQKIGLESLVDISKSINLFCWIAIENFNKVRAHEERHGQ